MKLKTLLLLSFAVASAASAYVLEGQSWTLDRTVVMQMSLNAPHSPFLDGSSSFDEVAQDAINIWNLYLPHLDCTAVLASPVDATTGDDEMSALFDSTIFGEKFGAGTLAITLLNFRDSVMEETDTVFNIAYAWNSYRGPLMPGLID